MAKDNNDIKVYKSKNGQTTFVKGASKDRAVIDKKGNISVFNDKKKKS